MRILHLCNATKGAPWLYEIARAQAAGGDEVCVVVAGGEGALPEALADAGVRVQVLPHDPFSDGDPFGAWRRIRRLAALIGRERPDVVQSHLFPSNIAGRIAAWLADAPIRLSTNVGPYVLESPVLGAIDLRTSGVDSCVIASCEYVRKIYQQRGVAADRTALVYYGSDPSRFDPARANALAARQSLGVDADTPLIGLVAYFYPPAPDSPMTPPALVGRGLKGHDVLLHAVPGVLAQVPRARVVLVGEGWEERGREYQREMQALAQRLGVADAVIFAGYRTDIPDLLAAFDVALQCSLSENVGGAIEALMMGRPMVVSATGGLVDAVRHDDTGLTVAAGDPAALAEAILALLVDRSRARRLGERGRALMLERFTVARTVQDLETLYRRYADAPPLRGRPPRDAGYRWTRRVWRTLTAPVWAWRLAPPVLQAITGQRSMSPLAMIGHALRAIAVRGRDLTVAVVVLAVGWPLFVWYRLRHTDGPLLATRLMTGRHGLPFPLRTFAVVPPGRWLHRLPWFITLLTTRHLTLFGAAPAPHDPAAASMARTDPRGRRAPGVFAG